MWNEESYPYFEAMMPPTSGPQKMVIFKGSINLLSAYGLQDYIVPGLPVSSPFEANILVSPTVCTFKHYIHIPVWNQIFNLICSLYCDQDQHILGGYESQRVPECHYFVHQAPCQAPNPSREASGSQGYSQGLVQQNLQYLQETN